MRRCSATWCFLGTVGSTRPLVMKGQTAQVLKKIDAVLAQGGHQ